MVARGNVVEASMTDLSKFEVCATITQGVYILHIECGEPPGEYVAEWSSRQRYPRASEIMQAIEDHVCDSDGAS